MFKLTLFTLTLFTTLLVAAPAGVPKASLKPVTLFLEGDSSTIPKLINIFREKGPEYGLDFKFVDKKEDPYDYRVILSSEGSGIWNYAHGNVVVMNQEAKLIFTVTRSKKSTFTSAR